MTSVPTKDLTFLDDLTCLYEGNKFTGIAIEANKHGEVLSEESYKDGVLDGLSKEYYCNC